MMLLRLVRIPFLALLVAALVALGHALASPAPGRLGHPIPGLHLGLLESVLLLLVSGIGLVVASYSVRNLEGQRGLTRYAALLLVTVAALALAVTTDSLVLLAAAWTVASQSLAGLVGRSGQPEARRAARLVRGRLSLGDLLLWSAVLVVGIGAGVWDRGQLPAVVSGATPALATVAALLLAGAGVVRSALAPAHVWLPETAAAPSPVSALLHAGLVNGVGVLSLLMWPLLAASWAARVLLGVIGLATTLLATAQGRTRGDLKGRLAASTSAQMGYLALQVALGIPAAVLAHIVGHGAWKARKFLGAGGAVQQSRSPRPVVRGRAVSPVAKAGFASAAALAVALAAGAPLPGWQPATAPGELLALLIAASAMTVAAAVIWSLDLPARTRWLGLTVVVVAGSAYVLGLRALAELVTPVLGQPAGWDSVAGRAAFAAVAACCAIAAVAARADRAVRSGRLPRLARTVASGSLRPWTLRERLRLRPPVSLAFTPVSEAATAMARGHIELAASTTATLFPLNSFVASNPLAGIEGLGFDAAQETAARVWGASTGPTAAMLRAELRSGRVSDLDIERALDESESAWAPLHLPSLPGASSRSVLRELLLDDAPDPDRLALAAEQLLRVGVEPVRKVGTPMEVLADDDSDRRVRELSHHLCIRSLAGTGWPGSPGPWSELWAHASSLDRLLGIRGSGVALLTLPRDPVAATASLLEHLGVAGADRPSLLARLLARDPGWPAHVNWRIRHAELGRRAGIQPDPADAAPEDLLLHLTATRLVLEVIAATPLARRRLGRELSGADLVRQSPPPVARLLSSAALLAVDPRELSDDDLRALGDWLAPLAAGELSTLRAQIIEGAYRTRLVGRLGGAAGQEAVEPRPSEFGRSAPAAQIVTCIDVRSERLRRRLEQAGNWETFGTAGFFGLPVRHVDPSGRVTERTPALLRPSSIVRERPLPPAGVQGARPGLAAAAAAIEASPVLALGWAEAAGWVLAPVLALATWKPAWSHRLGRSVTRRLELPRTGTLDVVADIGVPELAESAAVLLQSMGMVDLAPVVVLMGHGATVTNNPHVAAYDCGACGGAAGDVSARVMAAALNDERVRTALRSRGVHVPDRTVFLAALHDTTTDEVRLLDAAVQPQHGDTVDRLQGDLRDAGTQVRGERLAQLVELPVRGGAEALHRTATARAMDWAQPRPEWGLAGAAAIVVGPRSLSAGHDLEGRVFLQSYQPELDPQAEILSSLFAAPVVVAHWITAQYRASTLDPVTFGAGDKTTHNVVGDGRSLSAVVTGARGDLRIGLPWQAVTRQAPESAAGAAAREVPGPPLPVPQRLLVVVSADVARIETALVRTPEVAALVTGEWISLCSIDPLTGQVTRRLPDGGWQAEEESSDAVRLEPSAA